jgi:hypothetical protein
MEERRKDAVILVQQSMVADAHKNANFTLDVTADAITLKINGICVGWQPIRSHRIVYGDAYHIECATHVARALGIQAKKVHAIAFIDYDRSVLIEANTFACRVTINNCFIPLSLEEVTAAFVKLKKLGYEVVKN